MPTSAPTARTAALLLLDGVLGQGRLVSDLTQGDRWSSFAPADRAAGQRLALDTLRGLERADRLLKPHLRKAPPLKVHNILRLAVVELVQGGAAHGVVSAAVDEAARGRKTEGLKGLVNAVLRKLTDTAAGDWAKLRVPRLSSWLRDPLVAAWGRDAVMAMEAAHFAGAPLDLTAKRDPAALAQAVGGTLLPTGSVRVDGPVQVTTLPGYAEGDWWVQDAAAALPARLLGDVTGLDILDMCAAPGGKTMQLAAAEARVTALDLSEARLARVAENLARTGLTATCEAGDALTHRGRYDAILLDAPCSATGTIRRHPDLPHARQGDGISGLIGLQAALIDHALTLLPPGGRLVFCTCSLLPDEGECQMEDAVARHSGLTVATPRPDGVPQTWQSPEGGLRLRPDFLPELGGLDGFYMAVLQKPA